MELSPVFVAQVREVLTLERAGRHPEAIAALRAAAKAGNPEARHYLGQKLLLGERVDRDHQQGLQLLTMAGAAGHGEALHLLAVLSAAGQGKLQDWGAAMKHLSRAAEAGHARSKAQLALLQRNGKFDPAAWISTRPVRMQFESPRVGIIENFLSPEMCAWLIESGRPKLAPASIKDTYGAERASVGRTNSAAYMPLFSSDVVVQVVRMRVAAALKVAVAHLETPNVLHYKVGQIFETHFDYMDPALPGYAHELATVGQRVATFLVYLNDDFDGGDTAFPELGWRYRGKPGDAIFFWNINAEGAIEPKLAHAGTPPTRGEKWLFSQWVRDRPIPLI